MALFVCLFTIFIYIPALYNGFVTCDDNDYVYDNPYIRSFDLSLLKLSFRSYASNWHPLTWFSHAIDYAGWGLNPVGHHLTSIVFHGLNTFLVIFLMIRLFESVGVRQGNYGIIASGITGILFGVHPLHVESVAWISERKDVLCAFFFLLSILAYLHYAKESAANGKRGEFTNGWYLIALGLFLLSLLSKPMAVTLPVVLLIMDWYPLERHTRASLSFLIAEKAPFLMLSAVSGVLTIMAQKAGSSVVTLSGLPISLRIFVGLNAIVGYLVKMMFPFKLSPFYPHPIDITLLSFEYIIPALSVFIITVVCILTLKNKKFFLAIWLFYVITLFPVLGIIQVGNQAMADRYTYLPSLGPFLLAGIGGASLWSRVSILPRRRFSGRIIVLMLSLFLVSALSFLTIKQIYVWKNGITLWSRVIDVVPGDNPFAYIAYNNRGSAYAGYNQNVSAIDDFSQAIKLAPYMDNSYYNRANVYMKLGYFEKALEDYDRAIQFSQAPDTDYFKARGRLYITLGRFEDASRDYSKAIALDPENVGLYVERGSLSARLGHSEDAVTDYTQAINLRPNVPDLYYNRANQYVKLGRLEDAVNDYTRAITLSHRPSADYYWNRSIIYKSLGKYEEAVKDLLESERLKKTGS